VFACYRGVAAEYVVDMNESIPISVVILSHNEVANIPRCVQAAADCAEVVVLDDGSDDDSQAVARLHGVRVVEHAFVSFADQRNWAMDHADLRSDWVLHLDADEVMTPASLLAVNEALQTMQPDQVGWISRKVLLDDHWLRFSADFPVYVPRLIHKSGARFVMRGHGETIDAPPATAVLLREPLLHHAFSKGWQDWWERHRRYARAEAERIRRGVPSVSIAHLLSRDRMTRRSALRALSYRLPGRPYLRFLYAYIVRRGFLDGGPGFQFCRAMSGYERMIQEELRRP
jgi:glycosyltransferase involved in cell wall biosynthesis